MNCDIKKYTREEYDDAMIYLDTIQDLIIRTYRNIVVEGRFTSYPDVSQIYDEVKDQIKRRAYDITHGFSEQYISKEYVSNVLLKNKLYFKWGAAVINSPYIKLKTRDDYIRSLREELSQDGY